MIIPDINEFHDVMIKVSIYMFYNEAGRQNKQEAKHKSDMSLFETIQSKTPTQEQIWVRLTKHMIQKPRTQRGTETSP